MTRRNPKMSITDAVKLTTATGEIRGLRRRFVFAISLLVALTLLAQGAMLFFFGRSHLKREIEARANSYGTLAVDPICDAFELYFESGVNKFHQIIDEVKSLNGDLEHFAIYDISGERLFFFAADEATDEAVTQSALPTKADGALLEALRSLEPQTAAHPATNGRWTLIVPQVEEWGRHRYSVVFVFSYKSLEQAMFNVSWQIGGLALLALAVGVGCAFLLSAQSLGPVALLTQGARRLAEGELEHRIALRTGDEFEVLGATLDLMAERLASTVEDLEAGNVRLEALNRELREMDQVKSDLLANVSHELRTPLTAISGYVEAMAAGLLGDLEDEQRTCLEVVERNVRRLRGMIDQLLNYSRMESGRLEVELQAFDLERVARHVAEAVRAAHGPELDLRWICPPNLPEVYGDGGRIAQVIENLLTNAIKFSNETDPIELEIRDVGEGLEVLVRDRGIGIPEELREKIFERFYQVDASARRKFGGIGIGLALVREILELNHSRIQMENREAGGSTFRFILPLANERTGLLPLAGRLRVALVDDDSNFVMAVSAHLVACGFAVETAASGEQGWAMILRVAPDAVLLDRMLPDQDGFDLLRRLKGHHSTRNLPVILATVRRERALGLRLGAADYLMKPLAPEAVEAALRTALAERPALAVDVEER